MHATTYELTKEVIEKLISEMDTGNQQLLGKIHDVEQNFDGKLEDGADWCGDFTGCTTDTINTTLQLEISSSDSEESCAVNLNFAVVENISAVQTHELERFCPLLARRIEQSQSLLSLQLSVQHMMTQRMRSVVSNSCPTHGNSAHAWCCFQLLSSTW